MTGRYRFISTHSAPELGEARHAVTMLAAAVGVRRNAYYRWLAGAQARAARAAQDAALLARIRAHHTRSRCAYGSPMITRDLAAERAELGPVNRKRVARLMREHGIEGRHLRKRRNLTQQDTKAPPAPDLVGRDFTATRANEKWVGDITYVPLHGGRFVYFATVIDLFSRRLIGWSIAGHHRAELVEDALKAAVAARGGPGQVRGVIFHSDRGSEYTSGLVAGYCAGQGIRRSMGKTGVSYDNAAAEAFFASYKREILHDWGGRFPDEATARRETFRWIARYNHRRRHSAAAFLPPTDYENRHSRTLISTHDSATLTSIAA